MTDAVNHEITSEYVDESMWYLLLLPMHSETVLSGFQGESVHCNVKSNNTVLRFFWKKDNLFENCHQDTGNSWMDLSNSKNLQ